MNRRLGTVAIVLMALTALAAVCSFVFFSQPVPKDSGPVKTSATDASSSSETSSSSTSKSESPLPSLAPEGQSSAAKIPDQSQGSQTTGQNSSTNRITKNTAATPSTARRTIADILERVDLSKPGERERMVAEAKKLEDERKALAVKRAGELGLPVRVERPDGNVQEAVDVDDSGNPLYFTTHNANAAISTGADVLRTVTGLTGSGVVIGMWDGGAGRATHQEFAGGRMVVKDGAASIDHATHVGGTMIASGVQTNARGMAVAATVDSYDWNSDTSEFIARGATAPGQTNNILVSNHSYGYRRGWDWDGSRWVWQGTSGTNASSIETNYGIYNSRARSIDAIIYDAPYYLMFWSAGNERNNNPSTGSSVSLGGIITTYDPALHPAGDGIYRSGFETLADNAVCKNVVVVGAVTDAVTSGARDVTKANSTTFTSYGPTDDGRIKPDLVANGDGLYSSINSSDLAYGTYSGTSMASPNAAGTAALLIKHYSNLFPGAAMRASTLKGLLIHTADDRGNPGPDYKFGWGLMNGKAAADLITDHHSSPTKIRMTEGALTTSAIVVTNQFTWDGISPIRVTLCWTDPEGPSTTSSDLRTSRLINNLNLRVISPTGTTNLPYVMPFVATWTQASMDLSATNGVNNTDNVEQVYLATPPAAGVYQVVVSYAGTLTDSRQDYSLLVSGSAVVFQEEAASIAPTSAYSVAGVTIDVSGRPGFRDTPNNYTNWTNSSTSGNGFGPWTLTATPDAGLFFANNPANMNVGSTKGFGLYANGGGVATASRDFNNPMQVDDTFMLKFDNNLIDSGGQVGFSLADNTGAARLRFYFVGGEQFYRVSDSNSGRQTSIPYTNGGLTVHVTLTASNGYTLYAGGSTFSGTLAAGGEIRRLIVQNNNAGSGEGNNFYVGEMTMTGDPLGTSTNVRLVRAGRSDIVAGSAQLLSGTLRATFDLTGAAGGSWSVVSENPDGSILQMLNAFTINPALYGENFDGTVSGWTSTSGIGSNSWSLSTAQSQTPSRSYFASAPASKTTTRLTSPSISVPADAANMQLRFWHSYNFQNLQDGGRLEISINEGAWFSVESSGSGVSFASNGYAGTISSSGSTASRSEFAGLSAWTGNSNGFIETVLNITDNAKFAGKAVRFRWILATNATTASTGWYVDSIVLAGIIVANATPPQITSPATASVLEEETDGTVTYKVVRGTQTAITVSATDNGGDGTLAYTWSASGGLVSFSPNSNNSAKSSVATFSSFGDYNLTVTVTDGDGLITSSSVPVRVKQTATTIELTPPSMSVTYGETQQFNAQQSDQFGDAMLVQPTFVWSVSGGGSINNGLFTADAVGGPYTVTATDGVLSGAAMVSVTPAIASVTLGNLSATYDGTAKAVSVTTSPTNLPVAITYDGSPTAPTNAGNYEVIGTVTDSNYQGSSTNTLTISQATQTISFSTPSTARVGENRSLSASATSGLPVTFASSDSSTASVSGTQTIFQVPGGVTLTASQAGNENFMAASNVAVMISVSGVENPSGDDNGDGIPNLVEHALATNSSGSKLPILLPPTNGVLTLTAIVRTNDPGLGYMAHGITNLLDYANTNLVTQIEGTPAGADTNNVPAGFQRQEFRFTNNASRAFLKLTIEQN